MVHHKQQKPSTTRNEDHLGDSSKGKLRHGNLPESTHTHSTLKKWAVIWPELFLDVLSLISCPWNLKMLRFNFFTSMHIDSVYRKFFLSLFISLEAPENVDALCKATSISVLYLLPMLLPIYFFFILSVAEGSCIKIDRHFYSMTANLLQLLT